MFDNVDFPQNTEWINSSNLHEMAGKEYVAMYLACMPGTKWIANRWPEEDAATFARLCEILATTRCRGPVVLFSTVDVLNMGDESTTESWATHPYGRHRRTFEVFVRDHYGAAATYVLRQPALFGQGLKKNVLFDLLYQPEQAQRIPDDAEFQWYDVQQLGNDIQRCLDKDIHLVHLVSPPITLGASRRRWFPEAIQAAQTNQPVIHYNLTTQHSPTHYWTSSEAILNAMDVWICHERQTRTFTLAASNIGYSLTPAMYAVLAHYGIRHLEIAPGRIQKGETLRLPVVSVQSLLWGTMIKNILSQSAVLESRIEGICQLYGPVKLVFGSPKVRRGIQTCDSARLVSLFRRLGDICATHGATLCLEPNSQHYGCEWLTTVGETITFLKQIAHPHVRLSLDSGNYCLEGDEFPLETLDPAWVGHIQISHPHLVCMLSGEEDMNATKRMIGWAYRVGYTGVISYEAINTDIHDWRRGLREFTGLVAKHNVS